MLTCNVYHNSNVSNKLLVFKKKLENSPRKFLLLVASAWCHSAVVEHEERKLNENVE